jgi:hypothetical protein
MPLDFAQDCRCPDCLETAIAERIACFVSSVTPDNARAVARSLAERGAAQGEPVEGLDYVLDECGRLVFSKWYLLRRGECCESSCRNCPYGFNAS